MDSLGPKTLPHSTAGIALARLVILCALTISLLGLMLCTFGAAGSELAVSGQALPTATATPTLLHGVLLAQTDQRDPLPATWRLRYTIRLENPGVNPLYNLCITDTLPRGVYYVADDMGGVQANRVITWTLASLARGYPVDIRVEVATASWLRGLITNTVVVKGAGWGPITDTETTMMAAPESGDYSTATPTTPAGPTRTPAPAPTQTPPPEVGPWPTAVATLHIPTSVKPTPSSVPPVHLPPVIFVMFDFSNGDWANPDYSDWYIDAWGDRHELRGHPEYGALGGWNEFYWDDLNPHPGVYDWSKTDQYILNAQNMRVTLPDGTTIAKPVGIAVAPWTIDQDEVQIGLNHTPRWLAEQYDIQIDECYDPDGAAGVCKPYCTPNFIDPAWQYWFDEFILAMGQHYDNNPEFHNLAWINIATGVDEETVERKNTHGCVYFAGNHPLFDRWYGHVMETYNRAFPHIPQFIQATLEAIHNSAALAATFPSQMTGVKVNGLALDHNNAEVSYDGVLVGGVTGTSSLYHEQIPTGFEPGDDPGTIGMYWMLMEGLSAHPYLFDIQWPLIENSHTAELQTGFPLLDFVRTHLGKTPADTPDVWIVLRETEHTASCWQSSIGVYKCYGPHLGDFEYWLYRREDAPESRTVALVGGALARVLPSEARRHVYSYQSSRRTDQASGNHYMSFDIDDRYAYAGNVPRAAGGSVEWTVTVTLLNAGTDTLSLEYPTYDGQWIERAIRKGPELGPVNTWVDYTWRVDDAHFDNRLPGDVDFRLDCNNDGDEFIHRLIVYGE